MGAVACHREPDLIEVREIGMLILDGDVEMTGGSAGTWSSLFVYDSLGRMVRKVLRFDQVNRAHLNE